MSSAKQEKKKINLDVKPSAVENIANKCRKCDLCRAAKNVGEKKTFGKFINLSEIE